MAGPRFHDKVFILGNWSDVILKGKQSHSVGKWKCCDYGNGIVFKLKKNTENRSRDENLLSSASEVSSVPKRLCNNAICGMERSYSGKTLETVVTWKFFHEFTKNDVNWQPRDFKLSLLAVFLFEKFCKKTFMITNKIFAVNCNFRRL